MRRHATYATTLLALIAALFLCSCDGMYTDTNDISHITGKKAMRPFAQLNDPIVITMPVYQRKGLWGNESAGTRVVEKGDIFVVYDWETGTVYDWAFFAGTHGLSNWRAVEMGTPVKYYDAGESSALIGCLDAETGKISVTRNAVQGTFANLNNNNAVKSRYGIIATFGYENGSETYSVNFFDSQTSSASRKKTTFNVDTTGYIFTPHADRNGNYWLAYTRNDYNYLGKFDGNGETLTEYRIAPVNPNGTYDVYNIKLIMENLIILGDGLAPIDRNAIVYDMSDLSASPKRIPLPVRESKDDFFSRMVVVDGVAYAVFTNREGKYATNILYRLDIERGEFTYLCEFNFDFTETLYVRGGRIYFITSRDLERFACMYYDTATGELSTVWAFTEAEICRQ